MTGGQDELFDADELREPPAPLAEGEPSNIRTRARLARQGEAIAGGWHPLALTSAPRLRLHPDAAPGGSRDAPGLRCGSCRFRVQAGGRSRAYPKCRWPDPDSWPVGGGWPRESHGDGTDVARWWPGCTDYEPRPDAR